MDYSELKRKYSARFSKTKAGNLAKLLLVLLLVLSVGVPIYFGLSSYLGNAALTQYVDDCEGALLSSDSVYVVCCQDSTGKLYLCNDKRTFKAGDYIGVQVNLQKLNSYSDPYYACMYTDLPIVETSMPKKYEGHTIAEDVSGYSAFTCSKLFYKNDYHHAATAGYALDMPGVYNIVKVWILPDGNYSTVEDFKNNTDKGVLAFSLMGEIK